MVVQRVLLRLPRPSPACNGRRSLPAKPGVGASIYTCASCLSIIRISGVLRQASIVYARDLLSEYILARPAAVALTLARQRGLSSSYPGWHS